MDKCIYHSRDLDGLTGGAIIKLFSKDQDKVCEMYPLDYGEKVDIRSFKGKTSCIVDVALPMERMEALGRISNELIWIDHHKSQFDEFISYCGEKGYLVKESEVNGQIKRYTVNDINLEYFYSEVLSGCEMACKLYGFRLNSVAKDIVSLLGQYDTWRNNAKTMLFSDSDWEREVKPFQYGMGNRFDVNEIERILENNDGFLISEIINDGKVIMKNSDIHNGNYARSNNFEFDIDGLKFIGLVKERPGSFGFEAIYSPLVYDGMACFRFNGTKWSVSLYTDKEEVDILSIAKKYGGGGHKKACGFELDYNELLLKGIETKILKLV